MTGTLDAVIGKVPKVASRLTWADKLGHWRVRWGIGRYDFKVDPGIYALGRPSADSPILVTANYKLTFDVLRSSLPGTDAWILVLNTRGINVWCAAGKATFATDELVGRVIFDRLSELVSHRRLIVPQLGATGVSARLVRKLSGFSVTWGPIRASDISAFIRSGMKATAEMRQPTFTFRERLVLTPVEFLGGLKPMVFVATGLAALDVFLARPLSIQNAFHDVSQTVLLLLVALAGGAVLTPLALPYLPPRAFSAKGAIVGVLLGLLAVFALDLPFWPGLSTMAAMTSVSSFAAMNFTGATPFTSLSGVEREMRRWIPLQAAALVIAALASIMGRFA